MTTPFKKTKKALNELMELLKCCICETFPEVPRISTLCGHLFCMKCSTTILNCPKCNMEHLLLTDFVPFFMASEKSGIIPQLRAINKFINNPPSISCQNLANLSQDSTLNSTQTLKNDESRNNTTKSSNNMTSKSDTSDGSSIELTVKNTTPVTSKRFEMPASKLSEKKNTPCRNSVSNMNMGRTQKLGPDSMNKTQSLKGTIPNKSTLEMSQLKDKETEPLTRSRCRPPINTVPTTRVKNQEMVTPTRGRGKPPINTVLKTQVKNQETETPTRSRDRPSLNTVLTTQLKNQEMVTPTRGRGRASINTVLTTQVKDQETEILTRIRGRPLLNTVLSTQVKDQEMENPTRSRGRPPMNTVPTPQVKDQETVTPTQDKPTINVYISTQAIDKEMATPTRGRPSVNALLTTPKSSINKRNKKGETQLHVACLKGHLDEVRRLLDLGAQCSTKDYAGWTPLHEVAQQEHLGIAHLLLEVGARVNVPGGNLNTPLHEAVSCGNLEMARLLLKYGADPDQRNLYGKTSKELAENCDEIKILLENSLQKNSDHIQAALTDDEDSLVESDKPLVFMSSGLDDIHMNMLISLSKIVPFKIVNQPVQGVRLVVTTAKNNICPRSVAVLAGISVGAWIVSQEWIVTSKQKKLLVDPEPFEVYGVQHMSVIEAPKRSRINFRRQLPGLFAGCHFYLCHGVGADAGFNKAIITLLVRLNGGLVLTRQPDPEDIPNNECTFPYHAIRGGALEFCSHYIIYQPGSNEPLIKYNMRHIRSLSLDWFLRCIENFTLFDSF